MQHFFTWLFTLCALSVTAQTIQVSGYVNDHSGQPLEGISVAVANSAIGTLTTEDGAYTLRIPAQRDLILVVSGLGYTVQKVTLSPTSDAPVTQNFSLQRSATAIDEVAVLGKTEARLRSEQAYTISVIDVKKLHNTSADLNQVLNHTAGIRVRETGGMGSDFSFSLNGFTGNQVKFFLDGIPMENFGPAMQLNNIPVNLAERIEVYKGVVPVGLGADALGGAVNIITNQQVKKFADLSYSYGSFNAHRLAVNTRYTTAKGVVLNASGFYNYADNNFPVNVRVADTLTGVFGPERAYPHFHDAYRSVMGNLELGVVDKPYADRLLLGLIASGSYDEIQQGSNMQYVVGDAFTESQSFIPTLKYRKSGLLPNLDVAFTGSYNMVDSRSVDTSSRVYDWTGAYRERRYGSNERRGELGDKTIYEFKGSDLLTNLNLDYILRDRIQFTFNHTYSHYKRDEADLFRPQRRGLSDPLIAKHTLGLSAHVDFLKERLSLTAFVKHFALRTNMAIRDSVNLESSARQSGYGFAATGFLLKGLRLKASYEHAYRMPDAYEMLGDGLNVLPNPLLQPEESDNLNLGLMVDFGGPAHLFGIEASAIYRDAANFIRVRAEGPKSYYENMASVNITGIEGALRYGFQDWLRLELNGTYQHIVNTEVYEQAGSNKPNYLYKLRVPNIPFLFANALWTLNFRDLADPGDRLSVNWSCHFVEAFYLRFPSLGDPDYKREIPRQITQDAGITYAFKNGRYNITFEGRNLANTKVYDYFNVQKPGRTLHVKLRYFIR